jgi:hypothetical protein
LSSMTICGTCTTVSSSCWVAIPLAPQLETPKSAQIQATKANPLDLENSPKFSTNIINAADQQTKFEITFKFYSNYFQILLLKLFSNYIQISFKFYSKIRKLCHQELYLTSDIKFILNSTPTHSLRYFL